MSQQNPKLVMMRFDPRAGWVHQPVRQLDLCAEQRHAEE
jgi:hypothetical protein